MPEMTRMTRGSASLTVTVVIPVRNAAAQLERCLTALSRSTFDRYDCVVVDDGSEDGSAEVAYRHGADVIRLRGRHGPAHARNRGAAAARGDLLLFLDADVCVQPETVAAVAAAFARHPEIAALMGSYDDRPDDPSFLSQYKNLFHHYIHQCGHEEAATFWSGCGAVRRELFLAIGGFNEGYATACIEDIELGFRLKRAGFRIRLEKGIQVQHLKHWGLGSLIRTDLFLRGVPWVALMLRDRHMVHDLNLQWPWRVGTVLTYGLMVALAVLIGMGHLRATLPILGVVGIGSALAFLHDRASLPGWRRCAALGFGALPAAIWATGGLEPAALLPLGILLTILGIHHSFYRFFIRTRGFCFAAAAVPLQLLFFVYSGVAVPLGILAAARDRRRARKWATGPAMVPVGPLEADSIDTPLQSERKPSIPTAGAGSRIVRPARSGRV